MPTCEYKLYVMFRKRSDLKYTAVDAVDKDFTGRKMERVAGGTNETETRKTRPESEMSGKEHHGPQNLNQNYLATTTIHVKKKTCNDVTFMCI